MIEGKVEGIRREKYWNERDIDEKLEGLRQVLFQQHHLISMIHDMVLKLNVHQHLNDKMILPFNFQDNHIRSPYVPNCIQIQNEQKE